LEKKKLIWYSRRKHRKTGKKGKKQPQHGAGGKHGEFLSGGKVKY